MPTIDELTAAGTLTGTEALALTQNGKTYKGTLAGLLGALNGTVKGIDLSQQVAKAIGASTARTLGARFGDVFSVEDFGVVNDPSGTNVTANTAAYQAALTAAAGVARLRHRAGLTIFHTGLSIPASVEWELDGDLHLANGANATCANITGDNVVIRGSGTIDGNASNQAGTHAGIGGDGISDVIVRGITVQNTINWPFNLTNVNNCFAVECTFLNGGNSVEFAIAGDNCWFIHCTVDSINDLGVGHYGGFTNSGTIGCRVTNCAASGPFSANDSAQPGIPTNIIIAQNIVSLCGSGVSVSSNVGSGSGPTYTKISDNICFSNNGPGIICTANFGLSVSNNTVWGNNTTSNASGGEIEIGEANGSVTGAKVSGNLIINPGGGSQPGYGIKIYLPNQASIVNNTILDLRATPTMISGLYGPTGQKCFTSGNTVFGSTGTPDDITYGYDSTQGFSFLGGQLGGSGTLGGSPLFDGLPAFVGNLGGKASGFQTQGLSFGWNITNGAGECAIISAGGTGAGAWNGLFFYGVDDTGAKIAGPMTYGAFAKLTGEGVVQSGAGFQILDTGPTWTSGTGAPTSTQPKGSMYSRTDGAVGSTLYVSQGAGTWNPVAGV